MPVEIKLLQPGDEPVLESVGSDVFDDPLDEQATRTFLADPRHALVVAIDAGMVVGSVSAVHYVHPDKPAPELWINEVSVAGTHRGQGIGKAMLAALLEFARQHDCSGAWVLTERSNEAAMRLYSSLGGRQSDCVMYEFRLEKDQ